MHSLPHPPITQLPTDISTALLAITSTWLTDEAPPCGRHGWTVSCLGHVGQVAAHLTELRLTPPEGLLSSRHRHPILSLLSTVPSTLEDTLHWVHAVAYLGPHQRPDALPSAYPAALHVVLRAWRGNGLFAPSVSDAHGTLAATRSALQVARDGRFLPQLLALLPQLANETRAAVRNAVSPAAGGCLTHGTPDLLATYDCAVISHLLRVGTQDGGYANESLIPSLPDEALARHLLSLLGSNGQFRRTATVPTHPAATAAATHILSLSSSLAEAVAATFRVDDRGSRAPYILAPMYVDESTLLALSLLGSLTICSLLLPAPRTQATDITRLVRDRVARRRP